MLSKVARHVRPGSSAARLYIQRTAAAATGTTLPSLTTSTTIAEPTLFLHHPTHYSSRRVFSSYSSLDEPTLFPHVQPLSGTGAATATSTGHDESEDPDYQLRKDVRTLGSLLGQVMEEHDGKDILMQVEEMRSMAKRWREAGAGRGSESSIEEAERALSELAQYASTLTDKQLFLVSRAFTHFLSLANSSEAHHRGRRLQQAVASSGLYAKPDSCSGVIPNLLEKGYTHDEILNALVTQQTELVLTAHPTEVNRRTILDKKRRIQDILCAADLCRNSALPTSSYQMKQLDDAMRREIESMWLTDEVSRFKPSPQREAEKGVIVIETILWEAVPQFLRKLDSTVSEHLDGKRLPLNCAPVKFASWMGGDRDGNPNVKPNTTREVCLSNRAKAAALFAADLKRLLGELSLTTASQELLDHVGDDTREPYREFLQPVIEKMIRTWHWANSQCDTLRNTPELYAPTPVSGSEVYLSRNELLNELMIIHRSLCETGNSVIADGFLTDIIRNLSAFGLTLVPLDVRQESGRHEEAMDAITRYLGLGSYADWDEDTRITFLASQISSRRPLLRAGVWHEHPEIFSETAIDTLEIFQMIAEQKEDSLGAYVISQATSASDVLAVLTMQLDAGVKNPLRVVPLFETLSDLNGAPDTMRKLFGLPAYMGVIKGKQEVMVGYSDSAKDAGRLAAVWAQYETQDTLRKIAEEHSVDLTFFHGKGGTVGRGGNPQTFLAINAHPPKTINGKFRVTEQGEMIQQHFGYSDIAQRTMDIYTAAVLNEKLVDRPPPKQEWRDMMQTLSDVSCAAYRKVVRGDERFVPYFRAATPELELANLNIGSRPAKRNPTGGVESLRAIPWNFAWTQTRFNLPTWLGVGEALGGILKSDKAPVLREMYDNWSYFSTVLDLVEMVLKKSEPAIAKHYDNVLVSEDKAKELGVELSTLLKDSEQSVLDITGHNELGENNYILARLMRVRNPYVDCLNVLQAETLKRFRAQKEGEENKDLKDALMTTINGVAAGVGNTG